MKGHHIQSRWALAIVGAVSIGLACFPLLAPLFVTSNDTIQSVGSIASSLGSGIVSGLVVLIGVQRLFERDSEASRMKRETSRKLRGIRAEIFEGSLKGPAVAAKLRLEGMLVGNFLNDFVFVDANMSHGDFSNARCNGTVFNGCQLDGSSFVGAHLVDAIFIDTTLVNVDMSLCDLTGASIDDKRLKECRALWGATMPNRKRYEGDLNLPGDLERASQLGLNPVKSQQEREIFYSGPWPT